MSASTHMNDGLRQEPEPGKCLVCTCGDTVRFSLRVANTGHGKAYLRTNLGRAALAREEIIKEVENGIPRRGSDWHDVEMTRTDNGHFGISLPLLEEGVFQAKAFFLRQGSEDPDWPPGDNVRIKVSPAWCSGANSIYNAFVRVFGNERHDAEHAGRAAELEARGYTVIPPSGTFRDLKRCLEVIMGRMRFRIIQLLPIFPVPTTYGRMGAFGSPFAVLDFFNVDPALAEFDTGATPMDQFLELADDVHARHGRLFLDIPANATGWGSTALSEHTEWFIRNEAGELQSPGAWGVTWRDLVKFDYSHRDLWRYMADVLLFWCARGVDGFRCDAGYMLPPNAWAYMVAKVRARYPETVFLLEGLGGSVQTTEFLLGESGLDWAYSELFEKADHQDVELYLERCVSVSSLRGTLVHFAETHDNNRLAATSPDYSRFRTQLAALCSCDGAYGIACGVEWFATQKIDVHRASDLKWGNSRNQVDAIGRLNAIIETQPAFQHGAEVTVIHRRTGENRGLALLRKPSGSGAELLILANFAEETSAEISWPRTAFRADGVVSDLLTGSAVPVLEHDELCSCRIGPRSVACLCRRSESIRAVESILTVGTGPAVLCERQRLQAHLLRRPSDDTPGRMQCDAVDAVAAGEIAERDIDLLGDRPGRPMVTWEWPRDAKRVVPVPSGTSVRIRAPHPFTVERPGGKEGQSVEKSLVAGDSSHVVVIDTLGDVNAPKPVKLSLALYAPEKSVRTFVELLNLTREARVDACLDRTETLDRKAYAICSNSLGTMCQVRGAWGTVRSQYDALLAANLESSGLSERRVLWTRCRMWVVRLGYSHEIGPDCLKSFRVLSRGEVSWRFSAPVGEGFVAPLEVRFALDERRNAASFQVGRLSDNIRSPGNGIGAIRVVLRPDLENRSAHVKTKAYEGAETAWPSRVECEENGFFFRPEDAITLSLRSSKGAFVREPEWLYQVEHAEDRERGLGDSTDLFSPGYFSLQLGAGEVAVLRAIVDESGAGKTAQAAVRESARAGAFADVEGANSGPGKALTQAMKSFLVRTNGSIGVVAGYPWFSEWGRDTLIFLRGMISAGMIDEAIAVLRRFARFEEGGTLPNVIHGSDAANRDTSDAPLWFCVACADMCRRGFSPGTESVDAARSIVDSYVRGTSNGVCMDNESALVYSPPHFTWMDTSRPAATPRDGYPVEIQALWCAALDYVGNETGDSRWHELAARARESIARFFTVDGEMYLSDCLHTEGFEPAAKAAADDHLRPNQLFAVTFGVLKDDDVRWGVVKACDELVVPGALRSLADRPVRYPVRVEFEGRPLLDPVRPYAGQYVGPEDTARKPAYHNGTAWTWMLPSYCEALVMAGTGNAKRYARSLLSTGAHLMESGCLGHIPEIVDGDIPHTFRGCGAQAWSVSEFYRVWRLICGV